MSDEDAGHGNKIIWCFGERSKYAHAYLGGGAVKAGVALCGTTCIPLVGIADGDLSRKEFRDLLCPECLRRLQASQTYYLLERNSAADI